MGAVPPFVGAAVNVVEAPAQIVSLGPEVMLTEGINVGLTTTVAVPAMLLLQPVIELIATTRYKPPTVCSPKSSAEPVPANVPVGVLPMYNK